jgi:hypothetical protein
MGLYSCHNVGLGRVHSGKRQGAGIEVASCSSDRSIEWRRNIEKASCQRQAPASTVLTRPFPIKLFLVVEHSPRDPKVEGSSLAAAVTAGRECGNAFRSKSYIWLA